YLRLSIPKPAKLFFWLSIGVALTIITELLTRNLDLFQSPIMNNAFNNMENPLLFFLAIVVVAPTFEEIFYRGFIFKFLEMTRVGGVGAVLITSILFTLSHMQYEISILITVVPMALVLGFSRLFTRSLIVPITLHMFVNIIVFLLTALNI
ncbi:MAG: CPBP family intramembrane metalloprotease, partial [Flavobacteriales bacterium]|nr:CPBP family intramembrane metalloprotease [Flavobacteriales bacterium]